jgi:hypothetical protein
MLLAIVASAAVVVALVPGSSPVESGSPAVEPSPVVAPQAPVETASGPAVRAAAVLRAWDEARAGAWAAGSVGALRRLYVGGAGASDVRLLGAYLERGLRVRDLRVQVLALDVLHRRPREWRLRVTDRLAGGTAVGADGARQRLPRDRATTRSLVLRRVDGRWLMAAVR